MPPNYDIQANVIEIRRDAPKQEDAFFVDTNVWYWMTYTRASQSDQPPPRYQITDYPSYISKALSIRARICTTGLCLGELAHLIEKFECGIFRYTTDVRPKEYRHNYPTERQNVVEETEAAWVQIENMADFIPAHIDASFVEASLTRFKNCPLDVYDSFLIEAASQAGVKQVITDDGDFATVPGLDIFTCNPAVLKAARDQRKLVRR